MRDEFLWVEKYRPKTIEECILPEQTKKTFLEFLNKGEIPNIPEQTKKLLDFLDKGEVLVLQDVVRPQ